MLRQGMVVARQATATYIEVVVQRRHDFYSIRYTYRFFYLSENRFPVPVRAVNRIPVHKTRTYLRIGIASKLGAWKLETLKVDL